MVEVDSTGTAVVMPVTTRELIGLMEAESNLIKVESMSQRRTVHRVVARAATPKGASMEEFIGRLEEEEATEAPHVEPPADL